MYSILIRTNAASDKYSYLLKSDGAVYSTDSLELLSAKIAELLNTYTLSQIVPIKNCVVASNITVTEAVGE
jgi:hypothetical protein